MISNVFLQYYKWDCDIDFASEKAYAKENAYNQMHMHVTKCMSILTVAYSFYQMHNYKKLHMKVDLCTLQVDNMEYMHESFQVGL